MQINKARVKPSERKQEPFARTFFGREIPEDILRNVPQITVQLPIPEILMSSPSGLRNGERIGYF